VCLYQCCTDGASLDTSSIELEPAVTQHFMSTNQSASGTAGDNQSEAAAGAEDIDDGSVTPSQRFFSSSQLAGDPEQVTDVEKANGDDLIAWTDERPGSGRVGQAEWPNVNSTAAIHHRANSDTSLLASNT